MHTKDFFLVMLTLLLLGTGCRKDKEDAKSCRISRLITPAGKQIIITYNSRGQYEKIENGEFNETVSTTYNGNSIVVTRGLVGNTNPYMRTSLLLNSNGMVDQQRTDYYPGSYTYNGAIKTKYEYNGDQLSKATVIDSFVFDPSITTSIVDYTWEAGNLTKATSPTFIATYDFYTDKPTQQADIESITRFLWGYDINLVVRNKNLTKSSGSTYSYEFDENGKITAVLRNGDIIYLVEYECR